MFTCLARKTMCKRPSLYSDSTSVLLMRMLFIGSSKQPRGSIKVLGQALHQTSRVVSMHCTVHAYRTNCSVTKLALNTVQY